jgi:hypothetical protein
MSSILSSLLAIISKDEKPLTTIVVFGGHALLATITRTRTTQQTKTVSIDGVVLLPVYKQYKQYMHVCL